MRKVSRKQLRRYVKHRKLYLASIIVGLIVLMLPVWYLFLSPISTIRDDVMLYVDEDDNIDSVKVKIKTEAMPRQMTGFSILARIWKYADNVKSGRYKIGQHTSSFSLVRALKNGEQTPVKIKIPTTWTVEMMAKKVTAELEMNDKEMIRLLNDDDFCAQYDLTPNTIPSIFIPDTYEIYWNISPEKFIKKMYESSQRFWNEKRKRKAEKLGLSPLEVMILASIVDAETGVDDEKPMIAGLYLNRLHKGMMLQADPTAKFASRKFGATRIKSDILNTDDPYNTYKHTGLPPGPIRIPMVSSIDAVLNPASHEYLFMCAKGDGSHTHSFAVTYEEHQENAKKYYKALDEAGIK